MKEKVAIFIPAYNVAHTLPLVLDRIPKRIKKDVEEIFVIDNNSTDNSYLVAIGYKQQKNLSNLRIFKNAKNLGYGGSQKKAYKHAISRGMDYVAMLHGDAQYAPEMLPKLLAAIKKENAGMIFGSRMKGYPLKGGMPLYKFVGNKILTFVENKVLNLRLSEFHSGYRIYCCRALKKIPFHLCSDAYDFDTDILIQFRINKLKIIERPIPTHYGNESKHPSLFCLYNYCVNILKSMFCYMLHKHGIKKYKKFNIN